MGTHPIFESDFDCLTVLDMSPSPLFRTARWVALGAGYLYGQKRLAELRPIRAAERAKEEAIANAYMAAEIEAARLAMEEYAKESILESPVFIERTVHYCSSS